MVRLLIPEIKKLPIWQFLYYSDWCGKRDLNPHEDKASTDFKSVVSTIPPYPRKGTTPLLAQGDPK